MQGLYQSEECLKLWLRLSHLLQLSSQTALKTSILAIPYSTLSDSFVSQVRDINKATNIGSGLFAENWSSLLANVSFCRTVSIFISFHH